MYKVFFTLLIFKREENSYTHTTLSLSIYIYIYIYKGDTHGIMISVIGNKHGNSSSDPECGCLHFT